MGDTSRFIGAYALIQRTEANRDFLDANEYGDIEKKLGLQRLSCFAYKALPIFVSSEIGAYGNEFGLGLHNLDGTETFPDIGSGTYLLDLSKRDIAEEIAAFKIYHHDDLAIIKTRLGEPKVGWGYIKQLG